MADTHSASLSNPFLSGNNQYFSAADSASLSITGDITIECWINITSAPVFNVTGSGIVSKYGNGSVAQIAYALTYSTGAGGFRIHLFVCDGVTADELIWNTAATNLGTGTWHHLAAVWTASTSTANLYVDGAAQGGNVGTVVAIQDTTQEVDIGNLSPSFSDHLIDGEIDEVRIWSVVRTSTEINNNMCTQIDSATNLQASWHLDNSLVDSSGNSNTLTNHNSATFTTDVPTCLIPPVTFIPQMIIL